MSVLSFNNVGVNQYQGFYELSVGVDKVPNELFCWEEERKNTLSKINQKYTQFLSEKIQYVCVSDAHTHTERLVFVAIPINKNKTEFSIVSLLHIDGKMTFMSFGGDSGAVYQDAVYLRRIASANKMKFNLSGE